MRLLAAALSAFWVMAFAPSEAASDIEALYARGDFAAAVAAGRADGSAQALSLAARSSLAAAMLATIPDARDAAVDEGFRLAEAALARDPQAVEAHLQAAIALGLIGRRRGALWTHSRGLARPARAHIEAALAAEPDNPWAWAALGGWHLEIVAGGGAVPARLFYGARRDEGLSALDRAVRLAPDNLVIRYERALVLLAFDPGSFEPVARADLAAVAALEPHTALEIALKARAAELDAVLAGADRQKFVEILVRLRGNYERADSPRFRRFVQEE